MPEIIVGVVTDGAQAHGDESVTMYLNSAHALESEAIRQGPKAFSFGSARLYEALML
jgi:hypothetical protein